MAAMVFVGFGGVAVHAEELGAIATSQSSQTLIAYSLDYDMDRATGDKTIEYYGEPVREAVEQALRNNVNHPDSKETAKNSYGRKSFLNDVLPNRNKAGKTFSQDDFAGMRKTDNPKERLRK